jgi:hypothetical protein
MLQSKINTQVQYKEKRAIDEEDIGHESAVYSLEYFEKPIAVVLGKNNFTFINKGIVFYTLYVIDKDSVRSQIGIVEMETKSAIQLLDEDKDVLLSKVTPLFYSFVTQEYIDQATSDVDVFLTFTKNQGMDVPVSLEPVEEEFDTKAEPEKGEDVFSISTPKEAKEQLERANEVLKEGIFETDINTHAPPVLIEETEAVAKEIKEEFRESAKTNWLQDFMRNPHYSIHEVESNGDCFFATVRDAFSQIGQNTTVAKLRALLAAEVTDDIFQENRNLYLVNLSKKNEYLQGIEKAKKVIGQLKYRLGKSKTAFNKEESDALLKEARRQKEIITETTLFLKEVQDLEDNYVGFMKNIDSLEKFREYMQTSSYWADAWAISTLEHLLNVKFVIFSEKSFAEGAHPSVMNCGEANIHIERKGSFSPTYYIITSYSGNHYRLVTYKQKRIFTYPEIPYDVKILIVNKCIERNGGIYYYIQDFRNFKSRLGIDVEALNPKNQPAEIVATELYDPQIVFMFYSKSQKSAKPGKGSHEKIPADRMGEFVPLSTVADWRRKLDDDWSQTGAEPLFVLDGFQWASVEHYYQAAKFRKRNPQFSKEFALNSGSEISKSVAYAKAAGSKSGKLPKTKESEAAVLRPKTVTIDPDFYEDDRNKKEREAALQAKFTQNAEMNKILKMTVPAKLTQFVHSGEPEEDTAMMKIRQGLV